MDSQRDLRLSADSKKQPTGREPAWIDDCSFPGRPGVQLTKARPTKRLEMSTPAGNPAASRGVSIVGIAAVENSRTHREIGGELPSFNGVHCSFNEAVIGTCFCSQTVDENFVSVCAYRYVSRLLLGHCFGAFPAPCGSRSSALSRSPLQGHGSSHKKFENQCTERPSNFLWAPPRKQTFGTWEPGPLARLRPCVT